MNFESGNEISEVDYEDLIDGLLTDKKNILLLGESEIKNYENEFVDIENDGDDIKLYNKIKNRLNYISTPFSDYEEGDSIFEENLRSEVKKRTREQLRVIVEKCKNGTLDSIGKGFTAEVFQSKRCPKCCYKVIYDLDEYKTGLTIKEEALIQDELSDIEVDGVRVPKPYYYKMTPDSHVMVMETLDAYTLQDVESGKVGLPENFDLEKFISALRNFVTKMHSMGIHHRDLHDRNVLIDRETGVPRVIDFGKTKTGCDKNLESVYRNEDDIYLEEKNGKTIRYKPTDLEYVEMHYKKLKEIIHNNKG